MPDVFGLHHSNSQRQHLHREHTANMLHPAGKWICHKAQSLVNFADRLRQNKKYYSLELTTLVNKQYHTGEKGKQRRISLKPGIFSQ